MAKITIRDIADRAGVSTGAVSYALNGKPGVSEETRARVREVAESLGWSPNAAARSLVGAKAGTIGLVLARPARMLGLEPFYMEFIAGIEDVIAARGVTLMLHVVDSRQQEIQAYRKWWSEGRVDGAILVDLLDRDPRVEAVKQIGIPVVSVSSRVAANGLPAVWTDDTSAVHEAMRYLVTLGHKRIARVSGVKALSHTVERDAAFLDSAASAGVPAPQTIYTNFSGEDGARATRRLLTQELRPTAIVYDNDIMAVAGLGVANELGLRAPADVSLLAWDDSPLCEITHPPLSAMRRDVPALGSAAADMLLQIVDGNTVDDQQGPSPMLLPRASTAAV